MKLQSQISRKYGDTEYKKYWIVIPNKLLEKLGWKTGQELKGEVKEGKLVIEKND
jgi:bifunctional DNA-binding transcriptional regulator/antitoxin component of YhaV-PrlF toxin-antitoxin module